MTPIIGSALSAIFASTTLPLLNKFSAPAYFLALMSIISNSLLLVLFHDLSNDNYSSCCTGKTEARNVSDIHIIKIPKSNKIKIGKSKRNKWYRGGEFTSIWIFPSRRWKYWRGSRIGNKERWWFVLKWNGRIRWYWEGRSYKWQPNDHREMEDINFVIRNAFKLCNKGNCCSNIDSKLTNTPGNDWSLRNPHDYHHHQVLPLGWGQDWLHHFHLRSHWCDHSPQLLPSAQILQRLSARASGHGVYGGFMSAVEQQLFPLFIQL